jgi:hypothetical protein
MTGKYTFIPLGTRCTSAAVVSLLGKRIASFPFDWVDAPVNSIEKFIGLYSNWVEPFVRDYMSNIKASRHPDGTWFPHDNEGFSLEVKAVADKYVRRHKRLNSVLRAPGKFFFITVVFEDDKRSPAEDYLFLKSKIENIVGSDNCIFVAINLLDHNTCYGNFYNFRVSFINRNAQDNSDWRNWELRIAKRIKENEFLKSIIDE